MLMFPVGREDSSRQTLLTLDPVKEEIKKTELMDYLLRYCWCCLNILFSKGYMRKTFFSLKLYLTFNLVDTAFQIEAEHLKRTSNSPWSHQNSETNECPYFPWLYSYFHRFSKNFPSLVTRKLLDKSIM